MRRRSFAVLFSVGFTVGFSAVAHADVPAGYLGTPYKGTPWPIPGRVNMVDYDVGGKGVGFDVDHAGDSPCNGFDYRTDKPTVTLCKTGPDRNDKWTEGPMTGMTYPTATTSNYYIGAVRPGDWVNITVNVQKAGTYTLSTDWASDFSMIDVKISFNGVLKSETKRAGTGGYHNWIPAPKFATVQLDAGVQVMRFESVVEHVNPNYILFELVGEDGGVSDASTSGGAGTTGTDAGATGGTSGGTSGTSGAAGSGGASAGQAGTGGSDPTGGAGTSGVAGTTGGGNAGVTGTAGSSAAGSSGGQATNSDGGCACTAAGRPSPGFLALLLAALPLIRRRRSAER
jgi:MYXO-CTERM domain-containing protein